METKDETDALFDAMADKARMHFQNVILDHAKTTGLQAGAALWVTSAGAITACASIAAFLAEKLPVVSAETMIEGMVDQLRTTFAEEMAKIRTDALLAARAEQAL